MHPLDEQIQPIAIGTRRIGPDLPTYIIAEIGINHNGDADLARQLIDVAAEAKVDAVKFQKRHLPSLYRPDVLSDTLRFEQNFQYMIPILKQVELAEDVLTGLRDQAEAHGLDFLCTPFDPVSADFLDALGVKAFKIASADLNNLPLLEHVAAKGRPMIVSTGMSYFEEIEQAVRLLEGFGTPFALLHCRSVYPVWPREVNLRMINRLKRFGHPVGYSGHDIGITIPLVAASMGASIIEKHITTDKRLSGPDHKISLEPHELRRLVRDIRVADQAMRRTQRYLLRGEVLNRELFGKSLTAACDIPRGTPIERAMVGVQGPGKGLAPSRLSQLLGCRLDRDLAAGDFFREEDIGGGGPADFRGVFRSRWGLIARFADFEAMLAYGPRVIEFHLTEHDLAAGCRFEGRYEQQVVVHAPEYLGDRLMDLCSADETIRRASVASVNRTVALARQLAPSFGGTPKVVIHPGAMSLIDRLDARVLGGRMHRSFAEIDRDGVEVLPENLPPYPWYFGGQWKGNYFMAAEEIVDFATKAGCRICFDLSHAALYCNAKDLDLAAYIRTVRPHIAHVHFADGYGLDGEGVQIGEGDIDFGRVMPLFADYRGTWVPEIWRGHLDGGRGFLKALSLLAQYGM